MIVRVAGMAAVWVALWGEASPANIVWGIVVGLVLALVFPLGRAGGTSASSGARVRPVGALRFVGFVFVSLVKSSWNVVRAVISPSPERTETAVLTVPLATRSPLVASVVANSITLTPGTMTLACDPDTLALTVHVLGRVDAEEFTRSIGELERVVAGAFSVPDTAGLNGGAL